MGMAFCGQPAVEDNAAVAPPLLPLTTAEARLGAGIALLAEMLPLLLLLLLAVAVEAVLLPGVLPPGEQPSFEF